MDARGIFLSLFARIIFAGFLAVVTFLAVLMTGFSADSGANPVFIYLCISTLLFTGTGLICLVTPMGAISSGSKAAKIVFRLFLFSMFQPFLVFTIASFFQEPVVSNSSTNPNAPNTPISSVATICITQESIDPTNVAWIDIAIGNTSYSRQPQDSPLNSMQTSCITYFVKPSEFVKIRAYTSTPANAVEYWTGPAPEDVVSGELKVPISPSEKVCVGIYPTSDLPASWTSIQKPCSR